MMLRSEDENDMPTSGYFLLLAMVRAFHFGCRCEVKKFFPNCKTKTSDNEILQLMHVTIFKFSKWGIVRCCTCSMHNQLRIDLIWLIFPLNISFNFRSIRKIRSNLFSIMLLSSPKQIPQLQPPTVGAVISSSIGGVVICCEKHAFPPPNNYRPKHTTHFIFKQFFATKNHIHTNLTIFNSTFEAFFTKIPPSACICYILFISLHRSFKSE